MAHSSHVRKPILLLLSVFFPLCPVLLLSCNKSPKPTLFLFLFCFLPPSLGLYCREECQVTDNLASNEVLHSLQRTIWLAAAPAGLIESRSDK